MVWCEWAWHQMCGGGRWDVRIKTAHKILIGSAIILFLFYAMWETKNYANTGKVWALVRSVASLIVAVGFSIYFRSLKEWKF